MLSRMRDSAALSKIVNQSGFPLQLTIDRMVTQRSNELGWCVLYREHGWKTQSGESGFADLVLEDQYRTSVLVLECKRVLDCDWIFLEEAGKTNETLEMRSWVNYNRGTKTHCGYFDLLAKPESPSSMYCVVAGQDSKSRPLLERVAAENSNAMEAVALEEAPHMSESQLRMYSSVIVTTARLSLASVDSSKISLANGESPDIAHRQLPWLRFRKQLSSEFAVTPKVSWGFSALGSAREKSTLIVNSESLADFLRSWSVIDRSLNPLSTG